MFNVYKINSACCYRGYSLVSAECVEEANVIIKEFKEKDKDNICDSYGYEYVNESNIMEFISSNVKGIIEYGIYYSG